MSSTRTRKLSPLVAVIRVLIGLESLVILEATIASRSAWNSLVGAAAFTLMGMAPFIWFALRAWSLRRGTIVAVLLTIMLAVLFIPSIGSLQHPDDGLEAVVFPLTGLIGCFIVGLGTVSPTDPYPEPPRPDRP